MLSKIVTDVALREVGGLLEKIVTSDEERGQLQLALAKIGQAAELKSLDERIAFAQHPSIFVAGGRPFVIWAAGVGIAFNVVFIPLLNFAGEMLGGPDFAALQDLDWDKLLVLAGLAGGTSWVRHMDKVRGVARANLSHPDPSDMAVGAASRGGGGLY
jgi:hypothetical protein